jgi:hypothetical protein
MKEGYNAQLDEHILSVSSKVKQEGNRLFFLAKHTKFNNVVKNRDICHSDVGDEDLVCCYLAYNTDYFAIEINNCMFEQYAYLLNFKKAMPKNEIRKLVEEKTRKEQQQIQITEQQRQQMQQQEQQRQQRQQEEHQRPTTSKQDESNIPVAVYTDASVANPSLPRTTARSLLNSIVDSLQQ